MVLTMEILQISANGSVADIGNHLSLELRLGAVAKNHKIGASLRGAAVRACELLATAIAPLAWSSWSSTLVSASRPSGKSNR